MRISKILCLGLLATSTIGNVGGKTLKYGGVIVEYGSYGVRKTADAVLYTTENIGYYTKETGKVIESGSKDLNRFCNNYLKEDEYKELAPTGDFTEKEVENGWVKVDRVR